MILSSLFLGLFEALMLNTICDTMNEECPEAYFASLYNIPKFDLHYNFSFGIQSRQSVHYV